MSDGVQLACTYWQPAGLGPAKAPAVMLFHGLGGKRHDMDAFADRLGAAGYASLACDARGHGQSGGLFGLDGPRDVQDTRELFAWLGSQAAVNGSEIGALGISLGGGAVWDAAAAGVPFKAIVPVITWTNLAQALAPQGLAKSGLVLYLSQLVPPARFDPTLLAVLPTLLGGGDLGTFAAIAASRSAGPALPRIATPTLLIQGRHDFLFDIDQAAAAYRSLIGPKRFYIGDLGHPPAPNPEAEMPYYFGQAKLWLDRFLKHERNGIDAQPRVLLADDPWTGAVKSYRTLPPTRRVTIALPGTSRIAQGGRVVRSVRLRTRPETFGSATVSFPASTRTSWSHVVAVLSAGRTVISAGGTMTALTAAPKQVRIRLLNQAVRIPKGARLTLTLAATSTAQSSGNLLYAKEVDAGSTLTIGQVTLSLSVLTRPISG